MPIRHKLGLYNCMVVLTNGRLVFVYPKTVLANDDIYREGRSAAPGIERDNKSFSPFQMVCAVAAQKQSCRLEVGPQIWIRSGDSTFT
jgi:predicted amidohydrolase